MKYLARLAFSTFLLCIIALPSVPAAQQHEKQQQQEKSQSPESTPKTRRSSVPPKQRPRVPRGSTTGTKTSDDGNHGQNPPKGGGDDVGSHPQNPEHGDGHETPTRPPRGTRRPPFGVVITLGGGSHEPDRAKDDKKDKAKKDKKKDEPDPDPVASDAPRPLKYDNRAYRTLADSLLSRGQVDAAIRVLSLLKEQEYFEYTGGFSDQIADISAPASYSSIAERVASKKKKKQIEGR